MPQRTEADFDIAVHPSDLFELERTILAWQEGELVQMFHHEASCYYFVLQTPKENFRLDVAVDYRRDGCIFFLAEELLQARYFHHGIWMASPTVEFSYLLVKKVLKGNFPETQKKRLNDLCQLLGPEAEKIVMRHLGQQTCRRFLDWLSARGKAGPGGQTACFRKALLRSTIRQSPARSLRYWKEDLGRRYQRWKNPSGLLVAILGPDGAGKSSLIRQLGQQLLGTFRHTESFHFRPDFFQRMGERKHKNPHEQSKRSFWLSTLKLLFYACDYDLGFRIKVNPKLRRSGLVLFDRYYDDLLVDPIRYRYGGSTRLAWLLRRLVPTPDLYLILDVPPEQLLERKQELTRREAERQRKAYQNLGEQLSRAVFINGSLPLEEVQNQAKDVICSYLNQRYLKRRHLWFKTRKDEALEWFKQTLVGCGDSAEIVSKKAGQASCGWQIHTTWNQFCTPDGRTYLLANPLKTALELYNPQSRRGKWLKRGLVMASGVGVDRLLPQRALITRNPFRKKLTLLDHLKSVIGRSDLSFSISLGVQGSCRKIVIHVQNSNGETIGYAKVGHDETTRALVKNEIKTLAAFTQLQHRSFAVPELLHTGDWKGQIFSVQSRPRDPETGADSKRFSQNICILQEFASFHSHSMPLNKSDFWRKLLEKATAPASSHHSRILTSGLQTIQGLLGKTDIPFHFRHGDFTPWNMKTTSGKTFIYDWEYSDVIGPAGWDAFHFLFQVEYLIFKRTPSEIYESFQKGGEAYNSLTPLISTDDFSEDQLQPLFYLYTLDRFASESRRKQQSQVATDLAKILQLLQFSLPQ